VNLQQVQLPAWVLWIAQDRDGTWWGYQAEPLQNHRGWYENEVGRTIRLSSDAPNADWQQSLLKVDQPGSSPS